MTNRVAVLDLGTNTFHLLIAELTNHGFREILRAEEAVKLGEGGINKGTIQPVPFERGVKTIENFHQLIVQHNAQKVRAIATSALRNAANGRDFVEQVKLKTGINIEIINGETEAGYIYEGIKAGGSLSGSNSLIIDVGGGSCEFIICNNKQIFRKQSFEIGAARLMDKFHNTDPISATSAAALHAYLQEQLNVFLEIAPGYRVENIVGASGVFESYALLVEQHKGNTLNLKKTKRYQFTFDELAAALETIIGSTHDERSKNQAIIPVRVDMIVTASLLTWFVLEKLGIKNLQVSTNSLKEGVLGQMVS